MTRTRLGVAAAVVSLLLLGAACSGDDSPDVSLPSDATTPGDDSPREDPTEPHPGETVHVAQAIGDTLVVRASAQESADELVTLSATDEISGKLTCLVIQQVGDWVEVLLPSDSADRTGWVARDEVALSRHHFRIEVSRSAHTLTLFTGDDATLTEPVALGPDAPPDTERLFIRELVQPPDLAGPYGAYAYGLSGSEHTLDQYAVGSGVAAIHGTADPAFLGADAPAGSIGIASDVLSRLVDTIGLPLGTPTDIVE